MSIREAGPADAEVLPAAAVMRDIEGNLLGPSYRRAALDFSQNWLLGNLGPFFSMVQR